MSTSELLEALAAGRLSVAQASRELERQAARKAKARAERLKRLREAEAGRAAIAASSFGEGGGRPHPTPPVISQRQVVQAVAAGLPVAVGLDCLENWSVYAALAAGPVGHKRGRPRTEWVKDDEHRYYRPGV
jgi:hypothetical protein